MKKKKLIGLGILTLLFCMMLVTTSSALVASIPVTLTPYQKFMEMCPKIIIALIILIFINLIISNIILEKMLKEYQKGKSDIEKLEKKLMRVKVATIILFVLILILVIMMIMYNY